MRGSGVFLARRKNRMWVRLKYRVLLFVMLILFCGCSNGNDYMNEALSVREEVLQRGCSFEAKITADYGKELHSFTLQCTSDSNGTLTFQVIEPESISGITGAISAQGGAITFDDAVLAFPMLADGEISPVSAPWIFLNTFRSGYIRSCGKSEDSILLTIDDSYQEDAMQLDIWLNQQYIPCNAQIMWQGRNVLSIEVCNFIFM